MSFAFRNLRSTLGTPNPLGFGGFLLEWRPQAANDRLSSLGSMAWPHPSTYTALPSCNLILISVRPFGFPYACLFFMSVSLDY